MLENLFRRENNQLPEEIDAIEDYGKYWIIRFKGVLDKTTIPVNKVWADRYLQEHKMFDKNIIVDLNKVEHVDSSALAMCVLRLSQFKKSGHKFIIINAPEEFKRLAEIEKIPRDIRYYSSEKEAVDFLRRSK